MIKAEDINVKEVFGTKPLPVDDMVWLGIIRDAYKEVRSSGLTQGEKREGAGITSPRPD